MEAGWPGRPQRRNRMKTHRYRVTLEYLSGPEDAAHGPMSFETENHYDIFAVIRRLEGRDDFDPDSARALGLGLKLFMR